MGTIPPNLISTVTAK